MFALTKEKVRDRQRSLVYNWERTYVASHDRNIVHFEFIQNIVNWVWEKEGLKYPPLVKKLSKHNNHAGSACRTCVRFKEKTYTWIIFHELAHAMTSDIEHRSNHHGALFMGIYIQLLARYLKISYSDLVSSALKSNLRVKLDAKPIFINGD